jgi:site-specific recombinase XerD
MAKKKALAKRPSVSLDDRREASRTETVRGLARAGKLRWQVVIPLFLSVWSADHPGISPLTLKHYGEQLESRLLRFAQQAGIEDLASFTKNHLRAFVPWLEGYRRADGQALTPRGKQLAHNVARRFFRWAYKEKVLPEDIGEGIAAYKVDAPAQPRATSSADLEKVLDAFNRGTPTGIRNTALVYVLALCGLRVGELVALDAGDLMTVA